MGKHSDSADTQVLLRIQAQEPGWVFTPQDFADLGSRDAVATAAEAIHVIAGLTRNPGVSRSRIKSGMTTRACAPGWLPDAPRGRA
jgi:hypothetical protein